MFYFNNEFKLLNKITNINLGESFFYNYITDEEINYLIQQKGYSEYI